MQSKTVAVTVRGRVQGVGFRDWTQREATARGLTGWVRNAPDGTVVALLSGPAAAVAAMLERLDDGPPGAAVEEVAVSDAPDAEVPPRFRVTG